MIRFVLTLLTLSTAASGFAQPEAAQPKRPAPPNVLVILADDLGHGDVGFTGAKDIRTPNLDRLAATGVQLERFYACPVCSPTRAGLLTGRWPIRYGLMRAVIPPWSEFGLPPSERILPELLADAGYAHRGMVGKWHLGHAARSMLPPQRGFTHYYGHYNGAIDYFTHKRENEIDWHDGDRTVREEGYATDLLAREAVRFIEAAPPRQPWLLYAAFNAPHDPLQAKESDLAKYPKVPGRRRTYAAMVDNLDQAVGRLLAAVEARSDADNTLVLFMSDNGGLPAFASNAPWRDGKFSVYEGGIRVCAAIRWPAGGLTGGRRSDALLGYIDVVPTVLRAAGVAAPTGAHALDGIDMMPLLRGDAPAPERDWFSYFAQGGRPPGASVMRGNWKLVQIGGEVLSAGEAQTQELYRLDRDPREEHNVARENPELVRELAAKLATFRGWQQGEGVAEYSAGRAGFKAPTDWVIEK
ncbi:MAG: sulfatase-like hydrolase/transferase [Opitutaceae bacterium]|nr:sulfatase-like hydrolase/transferase [Opitutaceae bacterium]